jgi:rod shape-determining protein MreC
MRKYKNIIIIGIIILGAFIFNGRILQNKNNFLNTSFFYIIKPVGLIFSTPAWWLHQKISFFTNIGQIKKENQKLFDENMNLQSELAKLKNISNQNKILRQELKLAPRKKYNLEPALIIGRSSDNNSEIIYVNKGLKNGLHNKDAVLVGEGILIGKIIEITDSTAKIQLIIDNNFKVNAKIVENGGKGIVEGQFGTSALMKMIPQTVELDKGDTIITSELSNEIREGLLIGYVQNISTTSDKLFQEASILLPANFDDLYLVWILKP